MRLEVETKKEELKQRLKDLSAAQKQLSHVLSNSSKNEDRYRYETTLLNACEQECCEKLRRGWQQIASALEMKRKSEGNEIMGIALPKMVLPMPSMSNEAKRHLGAAMGYEVMLLERIAWTTNVPLLHFGRFEGSTSHVVKLDRIFDLRRPGWSKHRLYLDLDDLNNEERWREVVHGAQLIKRSLRCIAASLSIEMSDPRISIFDLLISIISQVERSRFYDRMCF